MSFLLFTLAVTWLAMPLAIRFASKHSVIDVPGNRRIHEGNIPRIGGIVFVPVVLIATVIPVICVYLSGIVGSWVDALLQYVAVLLIFGAGVIDDIHGMRYRDKFIFQILAGCVLCASGLYINNMHGILGIYELPEFCGWFLTVFVVVFCTNAMNFIDGVDGQAGMIAITGFAYYFALSPSVGVVWYGLVCLLFITALIVFLRFNLFAKQGYKTFMGDAGSATLGIVLSMLAISVCRGSFYKLFQGCDQNMLIAFAPLVLPCLDVVRVVIHRLRTGLNPFEADKNHIHHKLLECGLSPRCVMAIVVVFNLIVISACVLSIVLNVNIVLMALLLLWMLLNVGISKYILKKQNTKHNEDL